MEPIVSILCSGIEVLLCFRTCSAYPSQPCPRSRQDLCSRRSRLLFPAGKRGTLAEQTAVDMGAAEDGKNRLGPGQCGVWESILIRLQFILKHFPPHGHMVGFCFLKYWALNSGLLQRPLSPALFLSFILTQPC